MGRKKMSSSKISINSSSSIRMTMQISIITYTTDEPNTHGSIPPHWHPLSEDSKKLVSNDSKLGSNSNDCDNPMDMTVATPTLTDSKEISMFNTSSPFGLQFTKWFFELLNSQHDFGAKHFWTGSYMVSRLILDGVKEENRCITGSENVASHLSNSITTKGYFFQPYLTNTGVRTREDRHGLVRVDVGGVIYQHGNCIGVFDFSFGLVRDPVFDNNWKIKTLWEELQIKTNEMNSIQKVP